MVEVSGGFHQTVALPVANAEMTMIATRGFVWTAPAPVAPEMPKADFSSDTV